MKSLRDCIHETLKASKKEEAQKAVLDACKSDENPALDSAGDYATTDISLKAVAAVNQWLETDDLDDGETLADRLLAVIIGIADANKDGEITEDEQGVVDIALNAIWEYLVKYDVDESDIKALLEDWDADAAQRIQDLLASSMPDTTEPDSDIDDFVFGGDQEAALDATYKKKVVFKRGKKTIVNKRISGAVRLSAKQKLAVRKMLMKSHSATAQMHRVKSMSARRKSGR